MSDTATPLNNDYVEMVELIDWTCNAISFTGVREDSQTRGWQEAQTRNVLLSLERYLKMNGLEVRPAVQIVEVL